MEWFLYFSLDPAWYMQQIQGLSKTNEEMNLDYIVELSAMKSWHSRLLLSQCPFHLVPGEQPDCSVRNVSPRDREMELGSPSLFSPPNHASSGWFLQHISFQRLPCVIAWVLLASVPITDVAFTMALILSKSLKDIDKRDMTFEVLAWLESGLVSDGMSYFSCAALPAWSTLLHYFF